MLELRQVSGHEVIRVNEPLIQFGNSETFETELVDMLSRTRGPLILDMSETTFIGSSGIGVLANAIRATRDQQRRMVVVTPRKTILQVFKMTRFLDFEHFQVAETLEQAFADLKD